MSVLFTASNALSAGEASPGEEALRLGRSALEAYTEASWESAYAEFTAAEQLVHSPVFVLYMARCRRNLGQLLEARELLRSILRDPVPADAPAPWQQAVSSAHAELGTLQQNIPSVWIQSSPQVALDSLTIDGRSVIASTSGAELELDPGEHVVQLRHADGASSNLVVQLSEGQRRVPIPLSPQRVSKPSTQPARPAPAPVASNAPSLRRVAGYSSLGLGAVGVAIGAITGLMAKSRADTLKRDQCDHTGDCYPSAQPAAEAASNLATASTVSFIVGGGFLATGGVLLLVPTISGSHASVAVQGAF